MSKEKMKQAEPLRGDPTGWKGKGCNLCTTRPVLLPYGAAAAVLRGGVVQRVAWERSLDELKAVLAQTVPGAEEIAPGMCSAGRLLQAYSEGRRIPPGVVIEIPLEWGLASSFQGKVWEEVSKVPYGRTITYGELAARCGNRKSARAVGAALSRNPWPVIVPCHRVVGAGGRMVGFGKGIAAKRILLAFEERVVGGAEGCTKKRQNG